MYGSEKVKQMAYPLIQYPDTRVGGFRHHNSRSEH